MATAFLSTANSFISSPLSPTTSSCCSSSSYSLSSSSSSSSTTALIYINNQKHKRRGTLCKVCNEAPQSSPALTKRGLSLCFITSLVLTGNNSFNANAAILEADDDEELLEKVKKDRKKRLERQGIINSSAQEKGYLQDVVYKLSKIGQAIDKNDLSTASSVLGGSADTDWIKNANLAFSKISYTPEEKTEVETFNSSLASLISSVTKNDVESSKVAFVESASAFENWTTMTGLVGQLKGL